LESIEVLDGYLNKKITEVTILMFRRALSLGMNAWKDPKKKIKECHSKINIIFTTCYVLQMESPMDEKFTVMIASDCKKL